MRQILIALAALGALCACNPNAQTNNPAVATDQATAERAAAAPAEGANSFTEDQAKGRLADHGYSNPTNLSQASDGTWRGKAEKDGHTMDVVVDYQGNVTAAQ